MTDRLKGLTVTFEEDIREDDAEHIINAIKMIRGVQDVTPEKVDSDDYMARERVRQEMREKIWSALEEE